MYADMFNREYDGGSSNMQERIYSAGLPVEKIVPSIGNKEGEDKQEGGGKRDGPFSGKVVPVGLVLIQSKECSNAEYKSQGVQREVIPDFLYDTLLASVAPSLKKRRTTPKKGSSSPSSPSSRKTKSKRHKD
jgi:hypothetical protein